MALNGTSRLAGHVSKLLGFAQEYGRVGGGAGETRISPNATLLRKLSLTSKESGRRTLDFMRCRETWLLFDEWQRDKESASHTNEMSLCQRKLLTSGFIFRWHAFFARQWLTDKENLRHIGVFRQSRLKFEKGCLRAPQRTSDGITLALEDLLFTIVPAGYKNPAFPAKHQTTHHPRP